MCKVIQYCFFILFVIGIKPSLSAQQNESLHIVTEKANKLPGLAKFYFTINRQSYILKAGECFEKNFRQKVLI
jgi:hypothetical protein